MLCSSLTLAYQPNYGAFAEATSRTKHILASWDQLFLSHSVNQSAEVFGPTLPESILIKGHELRQPCGTFPKVGFFHFY